MRRAIHALPKAHRYRARFRVRSGIGPVATLLSLGIPLPGTVHGQGSEAEAIALEFQTSVQRLGWNAAAYRMHPKGLETFKRRVTIFVDADSAGTTRRLLFGSITPAEYRALDPTEVFITIMERFESDLPGIVNAWSARDVEILGTVAEGADVRHVLYRNQEWLTGSRPQLRVMTLEPLDGEWRVVTSPELEAVPEALRGHLGLLKRRGGSYSPVNAWTGSTLEARLAGR